MYADREKDRCSARSAVAAKAANRGSEQSSRRKVKVDAGCAIFSKQIFA